MPLRTSIDDMNTTLIDYSGQWVSLPNGSSRQWDASVHSTGQVGASATFQFRGYQIWLWGTIPAGTASNSITVAIDGATPSAISRTSNGSAVYDELYYQSDLLPETYHTIILTNTGSVASGSEEFMLDRFEFEGNDDPPLFAPPGSSASTPTATTSTSPTSTASNSSSSKAPIGAILGAIIGVLVLVIGALVFILWRKRRRSEKPDEENDKPIASNIFGRSRPTPPVPTPFSLSDTPVSSTAPVDASVQHLTSSEVQDSASTPSRVVTTSEKGGYHGHQTEHTLSSPSSSAALTSVGNVSGFNDSLTDRSLHPLSISNDVASSIYTNQAPLTVAHEGERPPPYFQSTLPS